MTRFPSSPRYVDCPRPSFHVAHIAIGPSQVAIGLGYLYVRKYSYFNQCLILYVIPLSSFVSDLLLSIPGFSLLLWPICHFGHRNLYTLVIYNLYIHRSALGHISVNLSLFRALHPLVIVAARVCHWQARHDIWVPLFPLLDFLVVILP